MKHAPSVLTLPSWYLLGPLQAMQKLSLLGFDAKPDSFIIAWTCFSPFFVLQLKRVGSQSHIHCYTYKITNYIQH